MDFLISIPFIIICVLLILVVLLQKGRGGGLGAALGGAGSVAFGTKVGDFMTWVTIVLIGLFFLLAICGVWNFRPKEATAGEPSFMPGPSKTITEDQNVHVTIKTRADTDSIFYTTDGSEPNRKSEPYRNAIRVYPGTVLKAIAYPSRGEPSAVVTAEYFAPQPTRPELTPLPNPSEPITGPTEVTIKTGNKTDKIYYTLDGSEPTKASMLYGKPVIVQPKTTLTVRAFAPHAKPSDIVTETYGVKNEVPPATTLPAPASKPASAPAPAGAGQ
ncbi:MAG: preprotein translocase subunit SecG [bacterium]|nr:preprotein translocase subunit SecG [bacterium]